jgi:tetratricopeptide (TPR) repeat protein
MGRALAQAEAAWADLHATGVAAEARALKRISKARQYLVAADSLVAPADSWLQLVELYLARAQVALTARQDPWALEEPVAQLLEQARRWADRSSDQQGETYFEAGEVLHDTVRRLVDLEWQEIELLQGFSTSVAGSTEAWSDLLLHHHQVLDSLPAELDGERLRQRQLARRDPLRRLAHGSAALLRDFAHRHPPAAEAVGDLTYLATAVVPQWLAEASDLAQFLLKVDPSDRAHVWWGQILLSEGDRLRARQMARRATELEPDMPSATRLLEELALPKKEVKKARLLESDSDAIQKFFLDYDRALEAQGTRLRPVAELFFERCKQTLASASQEQGVVQALQRRLDHGQALGPLDADLEKLARRAFQAYYEKSWRSPHVREYCRSILLVDPDHPLAHAVLGRWYARRVLQSKDPENRLLAEEHINAIPGEGTDHLFEVVSSLGFFQHHGAAALGDEDETARAEVWKQAIQYWKRAIALGHTRPYQDWVSIGLAWNELQGTTAAIQAFETAAKLAPSWSTPLVHSAQARVKLGHEGSALEDLFVAFERGERRSSALQLALELIWRRAGWQERAEKLVDDYVGKALLAPNARFALGRVQAWIGRTRDAEKSLGTASYLSRDVKKIEEYARFCEARKSRRTKLAWERLLQVIDDLPAAERRAHKKLRDEAKKRIRELERELRERGS